MLWEGAVLGAAQAQDTRTALGAKEFNRTKSTDGGTEGKHMASSPAFSSVMDSIFQETLDKH